ncbi:acetoacetate--CoA ligase [Nitratireductor basaltis]|uniref:Acetoacetyl-CoA synthetase n=1 Tax=Nitratireductor basaltis TaxID=472175 RepID=A0A084UDR8_9HYPH|nr:acetoacetate--CoA ligase [Nitratireductor basaltis]KFB11104.1 Acetoacetyl-CoA synthetase [Nitratireductor basaltis]
MQSSKPLWAPSQDRVAASAMADFMHKAASASGRDISTYEALHAWSVAEPDCFWSLVWDYCGVRGEKGKTVLQDGGQMPGARFFPEAELNFAENLLKKTGADDALVFRGEDKAERRMNWDELHALVSRLQQFFTAEGVQKGDRIAAMMPNMPETVAAMLAAASIGAIWSSCSPDFGVRGVLDRFGQIEPVIFIAPDGYWYNGKAFDVADKTREILDQLPSVRRALIVDYLGRAEESASTIGRASSLDAALAPYEEKPVRFEPLPFDHPLYILFSSGTTGIPKCIVHSAGGTLLQHVKEHRLHADIREGDRFFYFTTCGWMMWNWLVTGLASGATLLLYDGSPFAPDGNVLFNFAEDEGMTYFGTSAKFIDAVRKAELKPKDSHDLGKLRTMSSTGSPLAPENFRFVYEGIKDDIHLASISGGTDIVSCFVLGVPTLPVWTGEIQAAGLGMAVDVWDDDGKPLPSGKGELVCTNPFPSMPIGFWNDPDGSKYRAAYFERFPNVWCHGDFAEWTEHGGLVIHGRSDATLNPGGVRIGTAEIYNQVEQMPEVLEAICIGQDWEDDVRVVLFVRIVEGAVLDEALEKAIRTRIRTGASPRHVPARIIAVEDIPRTKSGKITELAVRDVVHGRAVKNKEALANPEALELYRDLPQLAQ